MELLLEGRKALADMSSLKDLKLIMKISNKAVKAKLGEDIEKPRNNFKNESMEQFDFEKNAITNEKVESFVRYREEYEAIIQATKFEVRITIVTTEHIEGYLFIQTNLSAKVIVTEKYVLNNHQTLKNLWEYKHETIYLSLKLTAKFEIVKYTIFYLIERS